VLDATLRVLSAELSNDCPGVQTAVHRLVDVLVVHLLRTWLDADADGAAWSWTAPLDVEVTSALARVQADPARRWTVGALAAAVGLSRAAFARRFTELVGEPPSTYLTRRRLELAARRLRDTTESLRAIADAVGYSSEFTFSRAFTRAYGEPPGRYRANGRGRGRT
jgi:AraC-like DNA-binding protein